VGVATVDRTTKGEVEMGEGNKLAEELETIKGKLQQRIAQIEQIAASNQEGLAKQLVEANYQVITMEKAIKRLKESDVDIGF